ncbi:hypothetical protein FRC11_010419 [Ceratobasidium sp. 423]|nr:hypothetical protein FRC11_010419 [Ceratobasidium sp. 423]
MPPSYPKSSNKSSNKLPFTIDSIEQYEPFQKLETKVQAKIRELLNSGVVSPKGNIKRPPNSFMLFRQNRLSDMAKYHESEANGTSKPKPSMVKNEWNGSETGKAEYSMLAQHVRQEHYAMYPGYKYTPIPERKWNAINEEGRKKWFFDFLSLICTNMVHWHPGAKASGLEVDEWIRDPANHKYVRSEVLDEALSNTMSTTRTSRGSGGRSAGRTRRNRISEIDTQPGNNSTQVFLVRRVDDHGHTDATLPAGAEACLEPQHSTQNPPPYSDTTYAFDGGLSFHSESSANPVTEGTHDFSQGDHSSPQAQPATHSGLGLVQNQVGLANMDGGYEDFTNYAQPLSGEELAPHMEQSLWNMDNMEGYNLHLALVAGAYNASQNQIHDQPFVTGPETAIDYTSVSQPPDQDGFNPCYAGLSAEYSYDYSELMKEFLDPSVLEDME